MTGRPKILFAAAVISLIILVSLPLDISQNARMRFVDLVSPVLVPVSTAVRKIYSVKGLFDAFSENRVLRKKVSELSLRIDRDSSIREENHRLIHLLSLKKDFDFETSVCRIISRDAGLWYRTMVIDKGMQDGLLPDMPVIAENGGVAGRIISCGRKTSMVLLVTDINSAIGGVIRDTRIPGIVRGSGSGICILSLIPQKSDAGKGAVVVTSGFSTVFPKGLVIGVLADTPRVTQELYKTAEIKLRAPIDTMEYILVLKNKTKR